MHCLACRNLFCLFHTSSDIYFIGGFGTVAWVDVKEYEALQPDKIAVDGGEQHLKVNALSCLERKLSLSVFVTSTVINLKYQF